MLKDDCGIQAVDVVKAALEEQLLLVPAGAQVVRMVPALVISSAKCRSCSPGWNGPWSA